MSLMPSMPLIDGIGVVDEEGLMDEEGLIDIDGIVLMDGELGAVELFDVPGVEEEPQAANARASAAVPTATAAVRRRLEGRKTDMSEFFRCEHADGMRIVRTRRRPSTGEGAAVSPRSALRTPTAEGLVHAPVDLGGGLRQAPSGGTAPEPSRGSGRGRRA
jgi:hypothetical protein